ncbi:MAG: ATP synthase F1 subunit delta [Patescibacteria group bacterium]|jgi:F-type H+-transporting ATPase subunit delta
MKISAQQYARGLYDSLSGKTEKEIKAVLKNFAAVLGRKRELNRATEIITAFLELWNREHGELAAKLISARELGPTARELVVDYLKSRTGAKKINLEEELDKNLIGGFILRYDNKVVDGSLRNGLAELGDKISS